MQDDPQLTFTSGNDPGLSDGPNVLQSPESLGVEDGGRGNGNSRDWKLLNCSVLGCRCWFCVLQTEDVP